MRELWLVRHGESHGNLDGSQADTALSARGREQARALRARLRGVEFVAVFCSPLKRARETAALAAPERQPVIDPRLRELVVVRERFVATAGLSVEQLAALLHARGASLEPESPGESGPEFSARVRAWIESLATFAPGLAPADGRVLAFSHFGVIRQILGYYVGFRAVPQTIAHCAIMQVRRTGGGAELVTIDQHVAGLPAKS